MGSVLVGEPDQPIGIVSEADIVRKVIAAGENPASIPVEKIMSSPLINVDIKTPIYKIYRTMTDHRIRHLVITQDGKKVGFVSVKDLLRGPVT